MEKVLRAYGEILLIVSSTRVTSMKFSQKLRQAQYRTIYELFDKTPRIQIKQVQEILGVSRDTATKRIKEAVDEGYIFQPQLRKKSFLNFIEHVYFVKCKDPLKMFDELYKNKDVIYHALMEGFADLWIVAKKEIDIDGVVVHGIRSDYHISYAPDRIWEKAMQIMREMVEAFDPHQYTPEGIIKTHWDESVEWTIFDETLFDEFNYDLRKPLEPLVKVKYDIWSGKAYEWLEKLPECCTILTSFFPKTISEYDSYLFMMETDYEDFIIHLFSQLPTSVWFFKVSGKLFVHTWLDRGSMRETVRRLKDISRLHIRSLLRDMVTKGIIKSEVHATVEGFWRKELDD